MIDSITQRRSTVFQRRQLLLVIASYLAAHIQYFAFRSMTSQASGGSRERRGGTKTRSCSRKGNKTGRIDATMEVDINVMEDFASQQSGSSKAQWTKEEVCVFVDYLHSERSTSDGGFKPSVWNGAARHLQDVFPQVQPPKKVATLKSKWNGGEYSVSLHIFDRSHATYFSIDQINFKGYHCVEEEVRGALG